MVEHPDFFDEEHLFELQQQAANLEFSDSHSLSFEQNFAMDLIQRIYSDDGNGDGRITAVGAEVQHAVTNFLCQMSPGGEELPWYHDSYVRAAIAPVDLFLAPSRREMVAMLEDTYENLRERMKHPMWEPEETDWEEYVNTQEESGLLGSLIVGLGHAKNAREVKLAYRDAVALALACHRYKKANGKWPESLDQLTGKWLTDTPIDRLNGKPLNFTIKDDAPVIYSLGHDGDDDGGVNTNSDAPWLDQNGDGDWVVWPQADM